MEKFKENRLPKVYVAVRQTWHKKDFWHFILQFSDFVKHGKPIQTWKHNFQNQNVRLKIFHSGFVTKAIQSGASYFMVKPISPENLEGRICEVLDNGRSISESKQLDEKKSCLDSMQLQLHDAFLSQLCLNWSQIFLQSLDTIF